MLHTHICPKIRCIIALLGDEHIWRDAFEASFCQLPCAIGSPGEGGGDGPSEQVVQEVDEALLATVNEGRGSCCKKSYC
jgi:hypothetical protein